MKFSDAAGKVLPNEHNETDRAMIARNLISTRRIEFIEALNQQFLSVKGYGLYAYISAIEVVRLFERFRDRDISAKAFAKEYVQSF